MLLLRIFIFFVVCFLFSLFLREGISSRSGVKEVFIVSSLGNYLQTYLTAVCARHLVLGPREPAFPFF